MTLSDITSRLESVKRNGAGIMAKCPAHRDDKASLSLREGREGILLYCFAGCSVASVCASVGIQVRDLFHDSSGDRHVSAIYQYRSANADLLYEKLRYVPKDFRVRRPDGNGGWIHSLKGVEPVLYNLPAVRTSPAIVICEGERDAETGKRFGLVATTAGSVSSWRRDFAEEFRAKRVCILPDADEPGRALAKKIAADIIGVAAALKMVELPGAKDLSDWAERGGTKEQLLALLKSAPELTREDVAAWSTPASANSTAPELRRPEWPDPLADEALHGLAGDVVRAIEPHSEADPAALLMQYLVAFGSSVGHAPYFITEADRQTTNINAVVVGTSGKGRKGTSWGQARRIFEIADQNWAQTRILSGLSSGEGLIHAVRDPLQKKEPIKEKGRVVGSQMVLADEGVEDKRLLVMESEFASPLRMMERDGNALSAILRLAWDTGNLRTLTKNSPSVATGAHVSILGHITRDELRRYLTTTDAANGLGNRFLWVCARRSKFLPDGGYVPDVEMNNLAERTRTTLDFARKAGQMRRDSAARETWHGVYPKLSEGAPGLYGAVTGRAEAQVTRLSIIYALLDLSIVVKAEHLLAALALWNYCADSARFIFGYDLGDPLADELLAALQAAGTEGLNRTDIHDHLGRNRDKAQIARALTLLDEHGLARRQPTTESTGGRPEERWIAVAMYEKNELSTPGGLSSFNSYSEEPL